MSVAAGTPGRRAAARVAVFGTVVVTALSAWLPAAHADAPTGAWTDPAPTGTYQGSPVAYLQRAQQLKGSADFRAGTVAGVSFTLVQDAAGTSSSDPCSATNAVRAQSAPGGASHVEFAFDAPFPCNRRYEVRATVTPKSRPLQSDSPLLLDLWVAVAIPPAATAGLTATPITGADRGVTLSWAAAAHAPDFQGFEIRRATGDGAFEPVADVGPSATNWVDHRMPHDGGTFRYQVVGMRPGPDIGTTVFADDGSIATATVDPAPASSGGGGTASGGDGSSTGAGSGVPTGNGVTSVHREFAAPGAARTATTVDTGYQERLPFKQRAGDQATGVSVASDGGADGVGGVAGDARQRALLLGGAGVVFAWAMLLRFLSRRALAY